MVSQLDRSGYGMEFRGFNEARIDLYAHRDTNLYKRGSVGLRPLVSNPKRLNDGETALLQKKATHGLFPWKPGEECMARSFREVKFIRDPFTNTSRAETTESYKGCKWCRELRSQGDAEEQGSTNAAFEVEPSLQQDTPIDPASPVATVSCPCGWIPSAETRTGKPLSDKQRRHMLTLHARQHTGTA